jgi:hypothetical protein
VVYIGYPELGRRCNFSRSTAYRGVCLLAALCLIVRESGGGKMYDEHGNLVCRANEYRLHPDLQGPEQKPPRKGKGKPKSAPPQVSRRGQDLIDEVIERHRARSRAGPDPP